MNSDAFTLQRQPAKAIANQFAGELAQASDSWPAAENLNLGS
ncbi:MAG TPA: hypothetical protein VL462_00835 [Candidatus Nitrosotalea sp.]|jgi:hypothetical protein|nr:hypothetical protein [Candidatus Nitrosotalea sp.]